MKLEIAELIESNTNNDECRVYRDYSGRGMYGETTTGITSHNPANDAFSAIANLLEMGDRESLKQALDIAEAMQQTSSDSLGFDTILY